MYSSIKVLCSICSGECPYYVNLLDQPMLLCKDCIKIAEFGMYMEESLDGRYDYHVGVSFPQNFVSLVYANDASVAANIAMYLSHQLDLCRESI